MMYHVPTGFGFSPKASGFYPVDDATDLASEGGGGDVVWMIQASASNHKPKGRFFWFVYAKGIPKEPSLWFVVYVVCLKSDMPQHQRQVRSTGIAKRLFFMFFVSVPPQYLSTEPNMP
ncbi:MAG: hypothetical protein MSA94_05225 [Bacteroidales bacterium]|nr:hypothetical protein [Bacteroidales bacterium]